ncbi:Uncharacterised protein [Mycobacteroides abscessus]|nr:Uncharacterised protein [Mycobacteroides abscessus]
MRKGLRKPIAKISGFVLSVPGANMFPSGIVYVPSSSGWMRSTLPRRSLVFADVRCASYDVRPARSSSGA